MTPFDPRLAPERTHSECLKCGARGGCEKHGLSPTGIDYRHRHRDYSTPYDGERSI